MDKGVGKHQKVRAVVSKTEMQGYERTGKPARVFAEFPYETLSGSWSQQRRVVAKAEHLDGKENPR